MWSAETLEWIDLEITSYCNINCPSCLRTTEEKTLGHVLNDKVLPLETIKEKITKEKFPNLRILNLCGTMDEPISHPQIMEIADYAGELNCHLSIATNGSLRTTNWWSRFADRLPEEHSVVFAIDGLQDTHSIYRIGSNYNKVLNNARELIKKGKNAIWQFIVFEHNKHQVEEAQRIAEEEGFYKFKIINSFRDIPDKAKTLGISQVEKKDVESNDKIECAYGKQKRIFITHLGDVIPCCHLAAATHSALNGNIITKSKYHQMLISNGGKLDINLKYENIEDIIIGDTFQDIISSWDDDEPIERCEIMCKRNRRNQGENIFFKA